jgi:CRP-like cAMP-binding protein
MEETLKNLYKKFGREYKRNAVIFSEGEKGDEMYFILEGRVIISKKTETKEKSKTLAVLTKGDFFGEMALLTDEVRSATAQALENTKLIAFNKDFFFENLVKYPKFAVKLLKVLAKRISLLDKEITKSESKEGI